MTGSSRRATQPSPSQSTRHGTGPELYRTCTARASSIGRKRLRPPTRTVFVSRSSRRPPTPPLLLRPTPAPPSGAGAETPAPRALCLQCLAATHHCLLALRPDLGDVERGGGRDPDPAPLAHGEVDDARVTAEDRALPVHHVPGLGGDGLAHEPAGGAAGGQADAPGLPGVR